MAETPDAPFLASVIQDASEPIEIQPPELEPSIIAMPAIKAVLFDVYGTLFLSSRREIGYTGVENKGISVRRALTESGIRCSMEYGENIWGEQFQSEVEEAYNKRRLRGVNHPEIDIREVWQRLIDRWRNAQWIRGFLGEDTVERAACEYECQINPIWPMPQVRETLHWLHDQGYIVGVVSNAQFFTPLLFRAFFDTPMEGLGINPHCCAWSYQVGEQKPSLNLFREAFHALESQGIQHNETLYVGNDARDDLAPAKEMGMKTALFAGDQRMATLEQETFQLADAVLTQLSQIKQILQPDSQ